MNKNKIILYLCVSLITTELFSEETKKISTEKTTINKSSGTVIVAISGQTIAQNSKLGQAAQKEFKAKQEKLTIPLKEDEEKIGSKDKELNKKRQELNKEAEEITNNKLLSQEAKQKKFEQLQDKVRILEQEKEELDLLAKRLQADAKRLESKLTQIYQEEMNQLDIKIKDIVTIVAQREGWDIVEIKESKVYVSNKVDKTDMIIKELDALVKTDTDKVKADANKTEKSKN